MSKRKDKEINCTFTSIWTGGTQITTPCIYFPKTGEVSPVSVDADPKGQLKREYITVSTDPLGNDEEEIEVCMTCHGFVMKAAMNPGIGHDLNEERVCSDPECESHEE
jgi:hypothetical protein